MSSTSSPSGLAWSTKGLQSVCPTGLATFDQLIGGGFALTSVNVIDEDCDRLYATMLAKAYLASGIIAGQRLIVFSSKITSTGSRFLKELPSLVKTAGAADEKSRPSSQSSSNLSSEEDPMKIAFRYSKLPSRFAAHQEGEDASTQKLDFGQPLDHATVESAAVEFFDHSEILTKLHQLTQAQHSENSATQSTTSNNQILRILIDELGSPLSPLAVEALPRTLHRLKVLLRALPTAVCLVTLTSDRTSPNAELSSTSSTSFDLLSCSAHFSAIRERIHSHADCVIRLIGFPEEEEEENDDYGGLSLPKNPYAADYAGFLHLLRLPRLNSFAPYNAASLETTEYGLKLRNSRRYLAVEKLALPPDLGETVSRFTSSSAKTEPSSTSKKPHSSLPCASVLTNF